MWCAQENLNIWLHKQGDNIFSDSTVLFGVQVEVGVGLLPFPVLPGAAQHGWVPGHSGNETADVVANRSAALKLVDLQP